MSSTLLRCLRTSMHDVQCTTMLQGLENSRRTAQYTTWAMWKTCFIKVFSSGLELRGNMLGVSSNGCYELFLAQRIGALQEAVVADRCMQ